MALSHRILTGNHRHMPCRIIRDTGGDYVLVEAKDYQGHGTVVRVKRDNLVELPANQ